MPTVTKIAGILLIALVTASSANVAPTSSYENEFAVVEAASPQLVPLYQYWNPGVHDHMYTTSITEIGETLPGKEGHHSYIAEGVACNVLSASDGTAVPLYEYYFTDGNRANHFYTTNADEIGTTTLGQTRKGYTYQGVAGYCYKTQQPNTIPLYRYYSGTPDHFYTTRTLQLPSTGYNYGGIECYVY